uniref:Zgc:136858 n=1 Tax=Paramormyrops kingsleyae TaxID=1676925 RepID=A0A3B3STS0_9TELE
MLWRWTSILQRHGVSTLRIRHSVFKVHPSVSEALAENKPVVALESTIITHGMPYPHNLNTAKEVEAIVRAQGSTPATVGILNGRVHVGLSEEDLDFLSRGSGLLKVSRRDLAYAVSKGLSGGTTVSGTMIAAHRVGISVFVTGGIGGVHRNGESTMDISADLTELGRTPIAVVSAGVKSILDIGRTLEFLETHGVCVATFGRSRHFPAFFTPHSGFASPYNVANSQEAAELIDSASCLGLQSGLLVAVPIPKEHAAQGQEIEDAVQAAMKEASMKDIRGKDVTPFILQRVSELTQGRSLQANMALILNNAKVGSQIACALSDLRRRRRAPEIPPPQKERSTVRFPLQLGQTNPGSVFQSFGGVGRNIADCLSRLGDAPLFISAVGTDSHSDAFLGYCKHMNTSAVAKLREQRTATYCVMITKTGELSMGLGDMDIHQQITTQYVSHFEEELSSAQLVVLDGNIPVSTVCYVCSVAKKHAVPVWFEPTDVDKAIKPFLSESWKALTYTSPNLMELCAMNQALGLLTPDGAILAVLEAVLHCAASLSRPLLEHLRCVVVTLGSLGVLLCGEHEEGGVRVQPGIRSALRKGRLCAVHYPAVSIPPEDIVNVSGAGDSLAAGLIAGILQGQDADICVRMGLLAARLSLSSPHPVAPSLCPDTVSPQGVRSVAWPTPTFLWMDHVGSQ